MVEKSTFKFAFQLYQQLCEKDFKNVFISPYSISAALSMVLLGAEGNTAAELLEGLGFDGSVEQEVVHKQQQDLQLQLAKSQNKFTLETLETANKLFIEQSCQLLSEFSEDSAKFYESESESVDFVENWEKSRAHINKWVEKKTKNKIKNLIPSGAFNSLTQLVIVNAIYFKGDWMHKFAKENTKPFDFFVSKNHVAKVQMMTQKKVFKVHSDCELSVQAVNLPYIGETISMVLLVPTERFGLAALEKKLSDQKLKHLTNLLEQREVILSMPRIKLEFSLDLIPILQELGIHDVFGSKANLSRISSQQDLFVSGVFHKAFLEVNEEGSEAAAATAVVFRGKSAFASKPKPIKITCDHPFMFLIVHNPTGSILFMGRFFLPPDVPEQTKPTCAVV